MEDPLKLPSDDENQDPLCSSITNSAQTATGTRETPTSTGNQNVRADSQMSTDLSSDHLLNTETVIAEPLSALPLQDTVAVSAAKSEINSNKSVKISEIPSCSSTINIECNVGNKLPESENETAPLNNALHNTKQDSFESSKIIYQQNIEPSKMIPNKKSAITLNDQEKRNLVENNDEKCGDIIRPTNETQLSKSSSDEITDHDNCTKIANIKININVDSKTVGDNPVAFNCEENLEQCVKSSAVKDSTKSLSLKSYHHETENRNVNESVQITPSITDTGPSMAKNDNLTNSIEDNKEEEQVSFLDRVIKHALRNQLSIGNFDTKKPFDVHRRPGGLPNLNQKPSHTNSVSNASSSSLDNNADGANNAGMPTSCLKVDAKPTESCDTSITTGSINSHESGETVKYSTMIRNDQVSSSDATAKLSNPERMDQTNDGTQHGGNPSSRIEKDLNLVSIFLVLILTQKVK